MAYSRLELSSSVACHVRGRLGVRILPPSPGAAFWNLCNLVVTPNRTLFRSLRRRIPKTNSVQINLILVYFALIIQRRLIIDKFLWPEAHVVPFHYRKLNLWGILTDIDSSSRYGRMAYRRRKSCSKEVITIDIPS